MTTPDTRRSVSLERLATGRYVARNARGGELTVDATGGSDFTPVELLLAAIGACTSVDVDVATSRRAEPLSFVARVDADKVEVDGAGILRDIALHLAVVFPEGTAGDTARQVLPRAARVSHDRTCTVSRTVEAGVPVTVHLDRTDEPGRASAQPDREQRPAVDPAQLSP